MNACQFTSILAVIVYSLRYATVYYSSTWSPIEVMSNFLMLHRLRAAAPLLGHSTRFCAAYRRWKKLFRRWYARAALIITLRDTQGTPLARRSSLVPPNSGQGGDLARAMHALELRQQRLLLLARELGGGARVRRKGQPLLRPAPAPLVQGDGKDDNRPRHDVLHPIRKVQLGAAVADGRHNHRPHQAAKDCSLAAR